MNLGDGGDQLTMVGNTTGNAVLPQDLLVNLGEGDNGFSITGGFAIAQDLLYTGGNNNNALNIADVATGRNLRATSGSSGIVAVYNAIDVAGDLRVTHTGTSGNVLFLGGSVDGAVVVNQGDAVNPGSASTFLFAGTFGSNVTINHAAGSNVQTFGGIGPVSIAGNLTITNGGVYSLVDFNNATIDGNVNVTNGPGFSQITLGYAFNDEVQIGGTAQLTTGDGDAAITVDHVSVGVDLIITTGVPEPEIGSNSITLGESAAVSVTRDLKIFGGGGRDVVNTFDVSARDLRFDLGDGINELYVTGATASRDFIVDNGDDQAWGQFIDIDDVAVTGDMSISSDGSTGSFQVNLDGSTIGGTLRFTRAGYAYYTVGAQTGNTIGGNVALTGSDLSTTLVLSRGTVAGNVVFNAEGALENQAMLYLDGGIEIGGNVVMNSYFGGNLVYAADASIGGALTIQHGSGGSNEAILLKGSIGGNASIHFGDASNTAFFGFGDTFIVTGNTTVASEGTGLSVFTGTFETNNLTLTQAVGSLHVRLGLNEGTTTINGNLRAVSGDGFGSATADRLTVLGDFILDLGNSDPEKASEIYFGSEAPVAIGGDLRITTGVGFDLVDVRQTSARDILVDVGDGSCDVDLAGVTATRDLTVIHGVDGEGLLIDTRIDETSVGRNLRITVDDALNIPSVRVRATDVVGNMTYTKGMGIGSLQIGDTDFEGPDADVHIGGNFVRNSAGDGGYLAFYSGSVGGSFIAHQGVDGGQVQLRNAAITGNVTLTGDLGNNAAVLIDNIIGGNFSTNFGDGSNFVSLRGGTISGNVIVRGGFANNDTRIGSNDVTTTINGNVLIDNAGMFTSATLRSAVIGGNFTLTSGEGDTNLIMGQGPDEPASVGGTVRVTTGLGNTSIQSEALTVAIDMIVDAGESTSSNSVYLGTSTFTTIGRDLIIRQANGPVVVSLGTASVGRHLKMSSQSGDDYVAIEGASVGGNTTIDTGAGMDMVLLGEYVSTDLSHGSLTVKTGAGDDTVVVGSNTLLRFTPTPNFLFDGGADVDSIDLYFAVTGPLVNRVKNFETIT